MRLLAPQKYAAPRELVYGARFRGYFPCVLRFLFLFLLTAAAVSARPFDFHRDTFPFSNDTVFAYGIDEAGKLRISRKETPAVFSHSCFLLTRGVLQFHKFARFAPEQPKVSREEYRRRILKLFGIPVWSRGPREKMVIPGFRDLRAFSTAYEGLLKENLGNWFATYIRVGNYRMMMGHPRAGQAALARWLERSLDAGGLPTIYICRFPKMNHVLIVYARERRANGNTRFLVYDCNYPGKPSWVEYVPAERSFNFQKRWYFPGGRVNAMRVYISPFH